MALLPEQELKQAEHSWLVTPSLAGTGAPGSPAQALHTKHLNLELGHYCSVFTFPLLLHGFRDLMLSRGVGLDALKHSSFRPV